MYQKKEGGRGLTSIEDSVDESKTTYENTKAQPHGKDFVKKMDTIAVMIETP